MKVTELLEARIKSATYTITEVKGKLDKVTTVLKGKPEKEWKTIADQYAELDNRIKVLIGEQRDLNTEIKNKSRDIFNVEDEVLTRVIDTCNVTLTLTKKLKKPSVQQVDAEAVVQALREANLPKQLRKMVDKIIEANTHATQPSETPERLIVSEKPKIEEGFNFIVKIATRLKSALNDLLTAFDKKFSRIENLVKAL